MFFLNVVFTKKKKIIFSLKVIKLLKKTFVESV